MINDSHLIFKDSLWLAAYGLGDQPIAAEAVIEVFDQLHELFSIGDLPACGSTAKMKPTRVRDPRTWFLRQIDPAIAEPATMSGAYIGGAGKSTIQWWCDTSTGIQWRGHESWDARDPHVVVGVALELARFSNSAWLLAQKMARTLVRQKAVWYGSIEPSPAEHRIHPSFFDRALFSRLRWERFVEQDVWNEYALGGRDKARGLFWGNIFGPAMAKRLRDAGYLKHVEDMREECEPVIINDDRTGSMAVFLDDDPVGFARNRDNGFNALSRCVKTGGALRWAMAKAGLL